MATVPAGIRDKKGRVVQSGDLRTLRDAGILAGVTARRRRVLAEDPAQGRGKSQTYWELVESYRTAKGSRHRRTAYLGKLASKELSGWQHLSGRLNGQTPAAPGLFDPSVPSAAMGDAADAQVESVDLKNIRLQRLRNFGDVYLAWTLWRMLGLDTLLGGKMPRGQEDVAWPVVAAILCVAQFLPAQQRLHLEQHFYPQSALEDLLGMAPGKVHTDRLYAGLDQLLPLKKPLEQHLRQRLGKLFDLSYDVLLYDLTSTYFEGQCAANAMAKRGYSRDSRGDCLQVVMALIVTTKGYPLGDEVFDGNIHDATTVQEIVQKVEAEHGQAQRLWVVDRGNVSEANLKFLRDRGGQYIVGTPKALLRQVPDGELRGAGWQEVRAGLQVKRVPLEDPNHKDAHETLILCRSEDRVAKESAMLDRFLVSMEKGLEGLKKSAETGRLKDLATAPPRLGRLKEKNWRAAACFQVSITALDPPVGKAKLRVAWQKNAQEKRKVCGYYLLRTNVPDVDPVTLWTQYIQLVDAEWAFRITKDELELRPVGHRNQDRVLAPILVCFIAYAMWKTLAGWMKASGLGDARTGGGGVLDPPERGRGSTHPEPRRLTGHQFGGACVTQPEEHLAVLRHRLGLKLPTQLTRFRLPAGKEAPMQMECKLLEETGLGNSARAVFISRQRNLG